MYGERLILKFALAVCLVTVNSAVTAFGWWNDDWSLRKKITIDTTASGVQMSDPIGTAVVLIRLHDGNFQFASAKEDGGDIRFVAEDDKTLLPFHIEKFDSLLDEAFVWVKVPDLQPNTKTSFWLYYGNGSPKAVKADDPKGTYDADTTLVYHFAEHGRPPVDSTKSAINAQDAGIPDDGSYIGTGLRLDGQKGITIPAAPVINWSDGVAMTWSAWIKFTANQPDATIFSRRDGSNGFRVGVDNGIPFVEVARAGGILKSPSGAAIPPNTWHQLSIAADGSKITLYLDGDQYAALNASIPQLNSPLTIDRDPSGSPEGVGMAGGIDELEISKVARSPGLIKFTAVSQSGDKSQKLLAFAEDEQKASFLSGYFAIILKSVTPDGWVVIGVLMVMAVLSWFVMANRLSYLNRVSKGNSRFLKEWNQLARNLTALDHGDAEKLKTLGGRIDAKRARALRNAPLYRIYHIGVSEIQRRLASNPEIESKGLSAQSIHAIRASLDAGQVRETQKLNRLIVFLTLSISGGPFLGLLGTVVGVMITFASIAEVGDVNVNAIAPGIAAALVATVAGLAVAIPALFGYNYLITRIKDETSDMSVFVDEFVTKMAEFYSGTGDTSSASKDDLPYASSI
jgi:biopolymer transport protein ExbB